MKANERCVSCRFWSGKDRDGQCRVNPPVVLARSNVNCWPYTMAESWCGKWESKEATRD